jgi:hypothetical protein
MNEIETICQLEVKRYFLLANALKDKTKHHKQLGLNILEEEYKRELDWLNGLDDEGLSARITDKIRLKRYDSMNWGKGIKPLENAGVWPKMQGSDISLTTGNVPETARLIGEAIQRNNSKIPEKLKAKIESMRELSGFVYERFPLIFFPGGEVREKDYNIWARGNDKPLCKIYEFDIDDGCTRAVAYALEGIQEAPVYFGEYRQD